MLKTDIFKFDCGPNVLDLLFEPPESVFSFFVSF